MRSFWGRWEVLVQKMLDLDVVQCISWKNQTSIAQLILPKAPCTKSVSHNRRRAPPPFRHEYGILLLQSLSRLWLLNHKFWKDYSIRFYSALDGSHLCGKGDCQPPRWKSLRPCWWSCSLPWRRGGSSWWIGELASRSGSHPLDLFGVI